MGAIAIRVPGDCGMGNTLGLGWRGIAVGWRGIAVGWRGVILVGRTLPLVDGTWSRPTGRMRQFRPIVMSTARGYPPLQGGRLSRLGHATDMATHVTGDRSQRSELER